MNNSIVETTEVKSLRFGGISPDVLRELSGVYQPFVRAVKEIISNSYDADAEKVELEFSNDYETLAITDNGSGMGPIEFVRDYIRIGKSFRKDEFTNIKRRPRIGGKGIGFLAPARYCEMIEVKTKRNALCQDKLIIEVRNSNIIHLETLFMVGHENLDILNTLEIVRITDSQNKDVNATWSGLTVKFNELVNDSFHVWYSYNSSDFEMTAKIDFNSLFSIDSSKSLEDIENFCEISINAVPPEQKDLSYTRVTMLQLKDFVKDDLKTERKEGARNVGGFSGIEQFEWNLSRIIPISADIHDNLPTELGEFIKTEIDKENKSFPIGITIKESNQTRKLLRKIIRPTTKLSSNGDSDLFRTFNLQDEGGDEFAQGFLVGQSTIILPSELRGILIRVKGVAVGEPTYFGYDQTLTGSAKVALSQISGEINIIKGIDAIQDINPGRDGFYKESKIYNLIKRQLVGEYSDKIGGIVKEIIDAIIARSEINASLENFKKKYQSYRNAILESASAIADLAVENPSIEEAFDITTDTNDLKLCHTVQYKAEGKLVSFSIFETENLEGAVDGCKVNFETKELHLDKKADIWKRNINIAGINYDIELKQGKQKNVKLFCQVNSRTRKIYLNWDHPIRTTMGDTQFIKHCLATIASELPQEQLDLYVGLMTNKN